MEIHFWPRTVKTSWSRKPQRDADFDDKLKAASQAPISAFVPHSVGLWQKTEICTCLPGSETYWTRLRWSVSFCRFDWRLSQIQPQWGAWTSNRHWSTEKSNDRRVKTIWCWICKYTSAKQCIDRWRRPTHTASLSHSQCNIQAILYLSETIEAAFALYLLKM